MVYITKKTPIARSGDTALGKVLGYLAEALEYLRWENYASVIDFVFPDWFPVNIVQGALIDVCKRVYNDIYQQAYNNGADRGNDLNKQVLGWVEEAKKKALADLDNAKKYIETNLINPIKTKIDKEIMPLVNDAQAKVKAFATDIKTMQDKLAKEIDPAIKNAQASLKTFQDELTKFKTDMTALTNTLSSLDNKVSKELDPKIKSLDDTLKTYGTKINDMNKSLSDFDTKLRGFDTKVSDLTGKIGAFDTKLAELNTKATGIDNKLKDVETKVNELLNKYSSLDGRLRALEGKAPTEGKPLVFEIPSFLK